MADICGKCNTKVMLVERVKFGAGFWHSRCFKCQSCSKSLVAGGFSEHQSLPYCNNCFSKNFKPRGYGFGVNNINSYDMHMQKPPEISAKPKGLQNRVRSSVNQKKIPWVPTPKAENSGGGFFSSVTSFFGMGDEKKNAPLRDLASLSSSSLHAIEEHPGEASTKQTSIPDALTRVNAFSPRGRPIIRSSWGSSQFDGSPKFVPNKPVMLTPQNGTKYCGNCGAKCAGAKFCTGCGTPVYLGMQ